MYTACCQIEAILNSRSLTPLSNDPNDLTALTPAHFLIGEPLLAIPEPTRLETPVNRLRHFQEVQKLQQELWQRWSRDYLSTLQQRYKWARKDGISPKVNDLVIISQPTPPLSWLMGRIVDLHPGSVGVVRVVSIKTACGVVKRSVAKIAILVTDRGKNFVSKMFREVCSLLGIKKLQTTAYNPSCNGMIERTHRVFKDTLSHFISRSQRDWDEWISFVLLAYRTHIQNSTGFSPYFLLHGRDPILLLDTIVKPNKGKYDVSNNYASELIARLNESFKIVRERLEQNADDREKYYNRKTKEKAFQLGDLVYLYDLSCKLNVSRKLLKPWTGPFRVVELISPSDVRIRKVNSVKEEIVHLNRLKFCRLHDQPPGDEAEEPNDEELPRGQRHRLLPNDDVSDNDPDDYPDQHLEEAAFTALQQAALNVPRNLPEPVPDVDPPDPPQAEPEMIPRRSQRVRRPTRAT